MSQNPRRDDDGPRRRRWRTSSMRVMTLAMVTTLIAALCPTTSATTGTMKKEFPSHQNLHRNLLTKTTRTWNDVVDETIAACATSSTEECVLDKLRAEV